MILETDTERVCT